MVATNPCSMRHTMQSFINSSPIRLRSTVFTIFIAKKHLSTDAVAIGRASTSFSRQFTKGKVYTIILPSKNTIQLGKSFVNPYIINVNRKLTSKIFMPCDGPLAHYPLLIEFFHEWQRLDG